MKKENVFKTAKGILDGVEMAEDLDETKSNTKCSWQDPEDVLIKRAEDRRTERRRLLDSIVGRGRICPNCRRKVWADSSWVIKDGIALCRSCFHLGKKRDEETVRGSFVVGEAIVRFEIDGWQIMKLRESSGIGLEAFANRMGWTKGYQSQIENRKGRTMAMDVVVKMIDIFEDVGVEITDIV